MQARVNGFGHSSRSSMLLDSNITGILSTVAHAFISALVSPEAYQEITHFAVLDGSSDK